MAYRYVTIGYVTIGYAINPLIKATGKAPGEMAEASQHSLLSTPSVPLLFLLSSMSVVVVVIVVAVHGMGRDPLVVARGLSSTTVHTVTILFKKKITAFYSFQP